MDTVLQAEKLYNLRLKYIKSDKKDIKLFKKIIKISSELRDVSGVDYGTIKKLSLFSRIKIELSAQIALFKQLFLILYAKITGYHKTLNSLPVYNWFEVNKGNYQYLYKHRIKSYPIFFVRLHTVLFYELEKINIIGIADEQKLAYLYSLYATEKNPQFLNQARSLEARIQQKKESKKNVQTLNDMVTLIEENMNGIGQINIFKISTLRFYSLYNRSIEKRDVNIKARRLNS